MQYWPVVQPGRSRLTRAGETAPDLSRPRRGPDSKLHRHGFCSARGGRRMRVGAADSAPVDTPMRAEGARLPESCSTCTRSVCARLLRPVLSPARRASASGNSSRLRQQSMSWPGNGNLQSSQPSARGVPAPGRVQAVRQVSPEPSFRSGPAHQRMPGLPLRGPCSIPGGSTIHPLASVPSPSGHHDPTTPRRLPLSLPNRHVFVGWERTPCGTSGDDPT